MDDLHATHDDARRMYAFLTNIICNDLSEITIMSDRRDFHRIFQKPQYSGDYLRQLFEWNFKKETEERSASRLEQELVRTPV